MRRLKINTKIFLMTFFIIAFSFLIAGVFIINNLLAEQEEDYEQRAMLIARTVSNMPELINRLVNEEQGQGGQTINEIVEEIRVINKAEYIVVMDMNRIKYSHPSTREIGQKSESEDINAAFSEHYYISKAQGDVGTMIRAFVPILNDHKRQIGVVVVGYLAPTLSKVFQEYSSEIVITILFSLVLSMWGALVLGRHIKKQMFGLEPEEISKMYVERQETFNAMHEGIIAIDNEMNITIFNEKASITLGVGGHPSQYIGQKIYDVLPDTRLPEIVESGKPSYNQELYINKHNILSNRVPIQIDGKNVGAVAVFKDLTEVKQLAEELTGVKAFVQALRVQTHEHKNKLHTVTGLLQLGHIQQALEYLTAVQATEQSLAKFLNERFHNENISGLLLSKISRGKELGVTVEIDEESHFKRFPKHLDYHDFVVIFGNLIENAFDAFEGVQREDKRVSISVDEHDNMLAILVSDNGCGMSEEVQKRIFDNGFSTKEKENRGIGLYLIYEIVTKANDTIEVTSEEGKGTNFLLLFDLGDDTVGDN